MTWAALILLKSAYLHLFELDFSDIDLDDIRHHGPALQHAIFETALHVRSVVSDGNRSDALDGEAVKALRNVLRAARVAIDLIGEVYLHHPRLAPGQSTLGAFSGGAPHLLVNPKFASEPVRLLPGDVILQRGMLHNSAAIARIGDIDSNFSHAAIVAEDRDGSLVMVEALIERGSVVTPLRHALAHGIGRAMLFRHRDAQLARSAAAQIHDHVAASLSARRPILYDFSMELAGNERLFCSKLVRMAYSLGSDGNCNLPRFTTRLEMKNRDFVDRIGVTAHETFAPGDLEIEPSFDIVAEWRDYRVTSELRLKDMIMTKLFEWMDDDGYVFRPDVAIMLAGLAGRLSTRLPDRLQDAFAKLVARVPPNMTSTAIEAVAMLHKTAEPLYHRLALLDDETIRSTGRPLHPRQALETLERIRQRRPDRIGYLALPGSMRLREAHRGTHGSSTTPVSRNRTETRRHD